MKLHDVGLKAKIVSGGLIPILLVGTLLILVGMSFTSVIKSVSAVDSAHRMIRQTVEIQASALGMLAWLRGFIITGEERFATEYKARESKVTKDLDSLHKTVAGNAELTKMVAHAEELFDGWVKHTVSTGISLRRQATAGKNMDHMVAAVSSEQSVISMNRFRDVMKDYVAKRQTLADQAKGEAATAGNPEERQRAREFLDSSQAELQRALDTAVSVLAMENGLREYLLAPSDAALDRFTSASQRALSLLEQQKQAKQGDPAHERSAQAVESALVSWIKEVAQPQIALRKEISASTQMNEVARSMATADTKQSFDELDATLASFKEVEENLLKERENAAEETAASTRTMLLAGMGIVILASVVISYLVAGAIARPLTDAVRAAEGISAGDLSRTLKSGGSDEIGRLAHAFNQMVGYLRDQTSRTADGIGVLASSAAEISATVSELAASSSKTSSAVAETTTTVEQVKQAAKVSSEKARKVAETAQQSVQITETGKQATEDTLGKMHLIREQMESIGETVVRMSEHSQAIEEIIATVQDLADQSNLLAVNASIEAARAGDQGKGFAVVAHEIKTLADQSKNATEQVRSILQDTRKWVSAVVMATEQGGKAVQAGVTQSASAGEAIQSLSSNVAASFQAASLIQTHTEQQFLGIEQVSTAMANIEEAMNENVASTSQLEVAARRIEQLGVDLKELVARFRT
jgi:methyl-accepting chemotaxis protein